MPNTSRQVLTKTIVERLPIPAKGRKYHYDAKVPSLAICVTSNGARTWYRCGKVKTKAVRVRIGTFADLTVENARVLAAEISLQVAAGKNPKAERIRGKTLGELWEWYYANHSLPRKQEHEKDRRRWERSLSHWAKRPIRGISRDEIVSLVNRTKDDRGPYGANHVLSLLRHMLECAVDNDWLTKNPARNVPGFERVSRERFLDATELPRFFAAVEQCQGAHAPDFIRLALWTGARRANVMSMRWDELNLESGVWFIPGDKAKKRKPLSIVLPPPAVELLRARMEHAESPWVFPSKHSKSGHYSWPKDAWKMILKRSGLRNLRIHDLRRTLGSWQAAGNTSLHIIGKSLGHGSTSATAVYARMNLDPVRKSVESAVEAMEAVRKNNSEKG